MCVCLYVPKKGDHMNTLTLTVRHALQEAGWVVIPYLMKDQCVLAMQNKVLTLLIHKDKSAKFIPHHEELMAGYKDVLIREVSNTDEVIGEASEFTGHIEGSEEELESVIKAG